jgi:hypothetical protein
MAKKANKLSLRSWPLFWPSLAFAVVVLTRS